MEKIIIAYTLSEALADGLLHLVGQRNTQPILVTRGINEELTRAEIRQVFGSFFVWQLEVEPGLIEEERLFSHTASNGKTIWVIDDGVAITMLYPEEY